MLWPTIEVSFAAPNQRECWSNTPVEDMSEHSTSARGVDQRDLRRSSAERRDRVPQGVTQEWAARCYSSFREERVGGSERTQARPLEGTSDADLYSERWSSRTWNSMEGSYRDP